MMTVNKIRVRNLAEAGLSHAVVLEKILSNQPKMLSAILIGNNIVNISASSLMTVLVTDVLGNKYVGIGTGVLTLLVLIFGEITPKTSATIYSETLSLKFAKPIYLIMQVLTPLIVVVDALSKGVLKMIHVDPNKKQDAITEDEPHDRGGQPRRGCDRVRREEDDLQRVRFWGFCSEGYYGSAYRYDIPRRGCQLSGDHGYFPTGEVYEISGL